MLVYTREKLRLLIKIDFVRFCIVGGTGFVINLVLLLVLHKLLHMEVFIADAISAEVALFSNFMLHHHWTYKAHKVDKSFRLLLIQFHSTTWPAILGSAGMVWLGEKVFNLSNIYALVISSAIAFAWNFFWSKYVVWRDVTPKEIKDIAK